MVVTCTLDTTYACQYGSGIGLSFGAVLASLFFFALAERDLIPSYAGLVKWIRYHDDVLAIFRTRNDLRAFFPLLKAKAQPTYVVVCESVHSVGQMPCIFLDLLITVARPRLHIVASQHKPITPLCPSSAHLPSIHKTWPRGVAKRIFTISGGERSSIDLLESRYQKAGAHPLTVHTIRNWQPNVPSSSRDLVSKNSRMIFILRYHPVFRHAFWQTSKLVVPPAELQTCLFASWKNALPSLKGIVQASTLKSLRKTEIGSREGSCFLFELPDLTKSNMRDFNILNMKEFFESRC
jgi:hypothetical protein